MGNMTNVRRCVALAGPKCGHTECKEYQQRYSSVHRRYLLPEAIHENPLRATNIGIVTRSSMFRRQRTPCWVRDWPASILRSRLSRSQVHGLGRRDHHRPGTEMALNPRRRRAKFANPASSHFRNHWRGLSLRTSRGGGI